MFYIISSRIPLISSDKTERKYFKLFIVGSLLYVALHYYLNNEIRTGIPEKLRKYIYYIMGVDYSIACILLKYIKPLNPEEESDDEDNNTNVPEQKHQQLNQQDLVKELEEQRKLFLEEHQRRLLHEKILEQKLAEQKALEQKALEQKQKENKTDSDKSSVSKKSISKSEKNKDKNKSKQDKPVIKEPVIKEDTEIQTESELPIYDK